MNNLIHALARSGDIDKAAKLLNTLAASPHSPVSEFVYSATQGLVASGQGDKAAS